MKTPPVIFLAAGLSFGLFTSAWAQAPVPGAIAGPTTAIRVTDFLNSLGVCVHVQHRQPAEKLVPGLKYMGVREVRDGADGNFDMTGLLLLHKEAGVYVNFGPGSGAKQEYISKTIAACKELASASALMSIEGPNEPNNFGGVTYDGQNSTRMKSWLPVAHFQKDLYEAVKSEPLLRNYPVYSVSEAGAEDDNVGLQFLTIPPDSHTLMPEGTKYADFLNCHNYVSGHIKGVVNNQATYAAATNPPVAIDHLFGNHGLTWRKKFTGYTEAELDVIPKVTTETGWKTNNTKFGDERQGKMLMNTYLAQYKAGWKHTFIYEFTDDADGSFGFYKGDLTTPRVAATYMHNLTTILADDAAAATLKKVNYTVQDPPDTEHDLLMEKSDGTLELVVWGEQVAGKNDITVDLGSQYDTIKIYDPTIGPESTQTLNNTNSVPLTIGDHALIVEFK